MIEPVPITSAPFSINNVVFGFNLASSFNTAVLSRIIVSPNDDETIASLRVV